MTLRARRFEKRVRPFIRLRIRASAALSRSYLRARRADRNWERVIGQFIIIAIVVFGPCYQTPVMLWHLLRWPGVDLSEVSLACVSLFSIFVALLGAGAVQRQLWRSADLNVLAFQPISDRQIVNRQYLRMTGRTLWVLPVCLTFYATWAFALDLGGVKTAAAIVIGAAQLGMVLITAILFTAITPRLIRSDGFMLALFGIWPLLLVSAAIPPVQRWVMHGSFAQLCFLLLPTGWLNGLLVWGVRDGTPAAAWLLVPVLLSIAAIPLAANRLGRLFQIQEFSFENVSRLRPIFKEPQKWESAFLIALRRWWSNLGTASENCEESAGTQQLLSRNEAREKVLQGEFLRPQDWSRVGWMERMAAGLLTSRERTVAQFLIGGAPKWTSNWHFALLTCILGMAAILIFRGSPLALLTLILSTMVIFGCNFIQAWPGFQWRSSANALSPAFCHVPISTHEITRYIMVLGCVRAVFYVPLYAGAAVTFALALGLDVGPFLLGAVKWGLVSVVLHRWWFALLIPKADSRSWYRQLVPIAIRLLLALLFLASVVLFFLIPPTMEVYTTLCAGLMMGLSWMTARYDDRERTNAPLDYCMRIPTNARYRQ